MANITQLNNDKLNEMILKRNQLLEENPQLKELQFKINDLLAGATSPHNKMVLLQKLMIDSMNELQGHLNDLETGLITLRKACSDEKKSI